MYENLPDKSRIHTSRQLDRIEHTEAGVRVHLTDGSFEEGDIVIGADGVHSQVRAEMWAYASKLEPATIPESDKSAFFTEFAGLFGVSELKEEFGLSPAETNFIYGQDETKMLFTQPGRAYWVLVFKDGYSRPPKKRTFTEEDIEVVTKRFTDTAMTDKIKFGDLWETRIRYGLLVRRPISSLHLGCTLIASFRILRRAYCPNGTLAG